MEHTSSTHATARSPEPEGRRSTREVLSAGAGEPLVLLHGVTGTAKMWRRVIPLLAPHHRVIAPTALGHLGGAKPTQQPTRIEHVIDDAEKMLDELDIERAHLAGNSMGGWVALELARRGRALSVCALSPAGAWGDDDRHQTSQLLARSISGARRSRKAISLLARFRWFRRWALRHNAVSADHVTAEELVEIVDDLLGCSAADDLLATNERLGSLTAGCPITLAWSEGDRLFPVSVNGARARTLIPDARFVILPRVGHVPMLDNPQLVADTILETTRLAHGTPAAAVPRPGSL